MKIELEIDLSEEISAMDDCNAVNKLGTTTGIEEGYFDCLSLVIEVTSYTAYKPARVFGVHPDNACEAEGGDIEWYVDSLAGVDYNELPEWLQELVDAVCANDMDGVIVDKIEEQLKDMYDNEDWGI